MPNINQKAGNEENQGKAASWIVPPCRFQFFVILVFIVIEGTKEVVRRVLRRGKALVEKAYIAWTNERNEHGGFVPERTHPFRSSSSDMHQSIFRSNGDAQFKDRVVPERDLDPDATLEPAASAEPAASEQPQASEGSESTLFVWIAVFVLSVPCGFAKL